MIGFIVILQTVLFLSHFLIYETWTFSLAGSDLSGMPWIKLALGFLSVSFIAAPLRYGDGLHNDWASTPKETRHL